MPATATLAALAFSSASVRQQRGCGQRASGQQAATATAVAPSSRSQEPARHDPRPDHPCPLLAPRRSPATRTPCPSSASSPTRSWTARARRTRSVSATMLGPLGPPAGTLGVTPPGSHDARAARPTSWHARSNAAGQCSASGSLVRSRRAPTAVRYRSARQTERRSCGARTALAPWGEDAPPRAVKTVRFTSHACARRSTTQMCWSPRRPATAYASVRRARRHALRAAGRRASHSEPAQVLDAVAAPHARARHGGRRPGMTA